MKCPVCGCKMKQDICPYCLVTSKEVKDASNKDAKIAIKAGKKENIHYTTNLPSDVSRKKLFWFSFLLGFSGAQDFYVGKYKKGWFSIITFILGGFFSLMFTLSTYYGWVTTQVFYTLTELIAIPFIVLIFFWLTDFIGVISKGFKVPILIKGKENK